MAMTGGTAKLVKSGTPSGWPGAINLYVYYKVKSQSVANNTTTLSLGMYVVTPSGWDIGSWSDYNGSYVGTATSGTNCKSFDGEIPNFSGTRWLVENQEVTVTHDSDGTKTAKIYWKWGVSSSWGGFDSNSGSFSITLTTIPRASSITSAAAVTLGNKCSVKWTPNAASFRYKLKFVLDDWSYTTGAIHPNTTSAYTYTGYTIPLDVAEQLTSDTTGTMTVTLYTYSNSGATTQVGSASSKTFTVTVPNNSSTKPTVSISKLTPVHSLDEAFDGLFIQGKSKVKASITGAGKYGATIKSYTMTVEGESYDSGDDYTSDYLSEYGSISVTVTAKDSRGFTNTATEEITVIAYSRPKILAASDEDEIICARCDVDGNLTDSGKYLKIKARRSYSKVISDDVQHNYASIRYRYRTESGVYGSWVTLLSRSTTSTNLVDSDALLKGALAVTTNYVVQVGVVDDIGGTSTVTYTILSESVFMHKRAGGKGLGLGMYCTEDNLLETAWDIRTRGNLRLGDDGLPVMDFVVETGVSTADNGSWRYRKWNSGAYDISGIFDVQPTESGTFASGVGYYSDQIQITLPFSIETVQFTGTPAEQYYWLINAALVNGSEGIIGFRLARFTEINTTSPVNVRLVGHGRYK